MVSVITHAVTAQSAVPYIKEHVYAMQRGTIFTCSHYSRYVEGRRSATFMLSVYDDAFTVKCGSQTTRCGAVVFRSLAKRHVKAQVPLISVLVPPDHPHFRRFRAVNAPGMLTLNRNAFASLNVEIEAAYRGTLAPEKIAPFYEDLISIAVSGMPIPEPLDPRIFNVTELLRKNPLYPLDDLAAAVGLSYHWLSHTFSKEMGLPLRSYQRWRKMSNALQMLGHRPATLDIVIQAGFVDLEHFYHDYRRGFGVPPSYFADTRRVKVIVPPKNLPTG